VTDNVIRFKPAPTDAELEAERDRQHALEVAAWFAHTCQCGHEYHDSRCTGESDDPDFGVYRCPCPTYRPEQ